MNFLDRMIRPNDAKVLPNTTTIVASKENDMDFNDGADDDVDKSIIVSVLHRSSTSGVFAISIPVINKIHDATMTNVVLC